MFNSVMSKYLFLKIKQVQKSPNFSIPQIPRLKE